MVEADGSFMLGFSFDQPYANTWVASTLLPFLQVTGRYVGINGVRAFSEQAEYGKNYGRNKDKVADVKLRLLEETSYLPALAAGRNDMFGTELFNGRYFVATKTFGALRNIEASVGRGWRRPQGFFAGVRWFPVTAPRWALVAEYDANDYRTDYRASETAAGKREKGPAVAVEYRWGWLGAQLARHRHNFSANLYVNIPFNEREFIPKLTEAAFFQPKDAPARVSAAEWENSTTHSEALIAALAEQNFRNIRVGMDGDVLRLSLTNNRISDMGRAVGRASRTALAFAPEGTRKIQVTYTKLEQPIATYEMLDIPMLSDYVSGLVDRGRFLSTVIVRYAQPEDRVEDRQSLLAGLTPGINVAVLSNRDGDVVQLHSEDRETNRLKLAPKVSFFFNDPSGALRYELWAEANYDRRLGHGLYLTSDLKATVDETVSGVTQTSNSMLPHVRTDIAEYKRGGRVKLDQLLLNQYLMPGERLYLRLSGGMYEEMYRGVGGQVLYLPKQSHWAADITVDALQQRGYKGWFDKRDYQTVTALGALHYRLPYDTTVTARVGRFLARDNGVRLEFKRRFPSGIEIGAWYTRTNGQDITSPGTPSNPYHDKGIFLSVPLNIMLMSDTQASADMSLAPWTRDVGQMVASPNDLYDMLEKPRRDLTTFDGLGNFAERADEQALPAVNPPIRAIPSPWPAFRWRLEQSLSSTPRWPEWADGTLMAGTAVLGGALLDKPVDRFVRRHDSSRALHAWGNVGKALPVVLTGAAGAAVLFGDARSQNIGVVSLESLAGTAIFSVLTKKLINRARPGDDPMLCGCARTSSDSSFPSNHSAVAFAAVTPFAKEYDAPWLYALAVGGSMGRVTGRQHWVSDVVAGSVIGYAMGSWLWKAQRADSRSQFVVMPGGKEISVAWAGSY
jgi:membrane-associated phospholipid phosphatase